MALAGRPALPFGIAFLVAALVFNKWAVTGLLGVEGRAGVLRRALTRLFDVSLAGLPAVTVLLVAAALVLLVLGRTRESRAADRTDRIVGKAGALLAALSLTVALVFFGLRWVVLKQSLIPLPYGEIVAVFALALAFVVTFLLGFGRRAAREGLLFLGAAGLGLIFLFATGEAFFALFPSKVPASLAMANPALSYGYSDREKTELTEYLSESPWIKFRPDTRIFTRGDRGPDFTSSWTTDRLGFKNLPELAARASFEIVAAGDSFVEAMGVPTEATWQTLLSKAGHPTYNLGVQGYAPVQAAGALKRWGLALKPKVVLFGYTPGFEARELHFLTADLKNKVFTGGIESINNYMKEKRVTHRHFKVTNALIDVAKTAAEQLKSRLAAGASPKAASKDPTFAPYADEVMAGKGVTFDPKNPAFELTLRRIVEARDATAAAGARFAILLFAQRDLIYHEPVTGEPAPATHYGEALRRELLEFCRRSGIEVIDLHEPLRRQVATRPDALPFFKIDGHLNETGQTIVADEVARHLAGSRVTTRSARRR